MSGTSAHRFGRSRDLWWLLPLLLFVAASAGAQAAPRCGVERWPVKVLADDDTALVDLDPQPTTVAALAAIPKPTVALASRRRHAIERRTFRVRAILLRQSFSDDDSDVRLILADPTDHTTTLIAEIPDSACALGSGHTAAYAESRRVAAHLPDGAEVEVEGVAFWDRPHGQTGMAPNAIELHPVLWLARVETGLSGDASAGESGATASGGARRGASAPADTSSIRVWLNLSSRVYHCPGAAYYGRTARGEYLTEAEARRRGARPAGGRPCQRS